MRTVLLTCTTALLILSLSAAALKLTQPVSRFVTWESLEPDIWASAWLIKRFIDSNAELVMVKEGEPLPRGVSFGIPGSAYTRASGGSAFAGLTADLTNPSLELSRLAEAISFIESTGWQSGANPTADAIEREYRRLQDRYGRRYVPISCYADFFDVAYKHINESAEVLSSALENLVNDAGCDRDIEFVGKLARSPVILKSIDSLLDEIAAGKSVVFVDTREPAEFAEGHIPGAINLPLRHIDAQAVTDLATADTVIAYCIKDFRGFEAARELQRLGVANAATMQPYGLAGWRQMNLPLAINDTVAEAEALQKLHQCAEERAQCSASI